MASPVDGSALIENVKRDGIIAILVAGTLSAFISIYRALHEWLAHKSFSER